MKKNIIFAAIVAAIVGLLYILSLETVVPIPQDENHIGIDEEIQCFDCHGEGEEFQRKKEHPPKDQCFECHKVEEG